MATITKKYKLIQRVKDDHFEVESLDKYDLCLEVGMDGFKICIIDTGNSRCLWLEDYRLSSIFFIEQLLDQLHYIFDEHPVLQAGYWKVVRVAFRNQPFTLIPGQLFRKENVGQYLRLVQGERSGEPETALYFHHLTTDIISVFSVETRVVQWFRDKYPSLNLVFLHQTSALMEGALQSRDFSMAKSMYVYVEGSYLTILVTREKSLEFCNTFFYANPQDFVYYVMFVMDELKMSPDSHKLVLYGALTHDSAIFDLLYKYVRQVSFGTKPKSLRFSYTFDEVMDHRYFSAYNIYLCE